MRDRSTARSWTGCRIGASPRRPFFAFLNYYDAHAPYVLPEGAGYRFGLRPRRAADFIFLMEVWEIDRQADLRPSYRELAARLLRQLRGLPR